MKSIKLKQCSRPAAKDLNKARRALLDFMRGELDLFKKRAGSLADHHATTDLQRELETIEGRWEKRDLITLQEAKG
jgi:hypothetical protein